MRSGLKLKTISGRIMNNPYKSEENTVVSFSGGRTSAFMLWKVLDAYDGKLPDNFKVCFANTGKEMPETLDFVRDCQEKWGVAIVWLERFGEKAPEDAKLKAIFETRVVDYDTASRNGEPFAALVNARELLPNPVARFCTADLKMRAIRDFVDSVGWGRPYLGFVGIRADEQRRAVKIMNREANEHGQETILPLFTDNKTVKDVYRFWLENDFDLGLFNNNGTTDWGNCDLCFLKAASKRSSIMRERPDLSKWWIEQEKINESKFRTDHPSYEQMQIIATSQNTFDFGDDETIPCFCGD